MSRPPADRIRVTFLIGSLALGGAERQLVALANRIDRDRFDPEVVTWYGSDELAADLAPEVPHTNLGLRRLASAGAMDGLRLGALVARLALHLRRRKPAILHAFLFSAYAPGALAARLAVVPVAVAGRRGLHGYTHLPLPARGLGRLSNSLIDGHICNSKAVAAWVHDNEQEVPQSRIFVVSNGVDAVSQSAELADGWRRDAPLAACIANFHTYKGHATLLRALELVPDLDLVLVGDGPARADVKSLADELGISERVIFAGARADAAKIVGGFDFTILASEQEGLPNVVMESMVAGVPVVATAVGGSTELVHNGVDGWLVPPGDPVALAERMTELASDCALRRRLGAAARKAMAPYSTTAMARRVESVYDQLLKR
jgi:glycosyltransferase involved in cell wall biosynthesis